MFTLLPSLYFLGVHYFRQWNVSQPSEENQTKIKLRKRKSNYRRRKTSTSELSHDEIVYLIKETSFTEEEIRLWYTDFLRDCPDGKLPKTKFIDIYQQFYKKGHVNKFCEHAFRLFDKDTSGYLDFMEFLFAVSLTTSKDPEQKIELFFTMYDIDRNGFIDENEMHDFVESIYELMGIDISDPSRIDSKIHKIFSSTQCDPLGYLRKEQFAIVCQNDRHIRKLLISNRKKEH